MPRRNFHVCLLLSLITGLAAAQTLSIEEYQPKSTLIVPQHPVPRAKYPVIDVHSHHRANTSPERLAEIMKEMDVLNLRMLVNLSGGSGDRLRQAVDNFSKREPKRFAVFANLNFDGIDDPEWGKKAAAQLEKDVRYGAVGLKFFKNFGMTEKYRDGRRMPVDDPALDPVWQTCARLKIPVLIHVGEPAPFFEPHDRAPSISQKLVPGSRHRRWVQGLHNRRDGNRRPSNNR
jgi:hypothetical protein